MSRMATKEYIGAKRRAYALADRAKRTRILDNEAKNEGEDLSSFAAHPGSQSTNRRMVDRTPVPSLIS